MKKIFNLLLVLLLTHMAIAQQNGDQPPAIEQLIELQQKLSENEQLQALRNELAKKEELQTLQKELAEKLAHLANQQELAEKAELKALREKLTQKLQLLALKEALAEKERLAALREKYAKKGIKVTFNNKGKEKEVHPFVSRWKGEQLPALQFTDLQGNQLSTADFAGKYVHINFWSTSCKPCIEEFPELDQIKAKYGDEEVIYLAIAPEADNKVKKVLAKHPVNYQVIANAKVLLDQLGVDGYPKNIFIDKDGTIMEATNGSHYTIAAEGEEVKMVPDNFRHYDQIMKTLIGGRE